MQTFLLGYRYVVDGYLEKWLVSIFFPYAAQRSREKAIWSNIMAHLIFCLLNGWLRWKKSSYYFGNYIMIFGQSHLAARLTLRVPSILTKLASFIQILNQSFTTQMLILKCRKPGTNLEIWQPVLLFAEFFPPLKNKMFLTFIQLNGDFFCKERW